MPPTRRLSDANFFVETWFEGVAEVLPRLLRTGCAGRERKPLLRRIFFENTRLADPKRKTGFCVNCVPA